MRIERGPRSRVIDVCLSLAMADWSLVLGDCHFCTIKTDESGGCRKFMTPERGTLRSSCLIQALHMVREREIKAHTNNSKCQNAGLCYELLKHLSDC